MDSDYEETVEPPSPFHIPWHEQAACFSTGWDLYFHEGKLRAKTVAKQAKSFCCRCPVQVECLQSSLEHRDRYGIWGGLTPKERGRLLRLIDAGELTIEAALEMIIDAPSNSSPAAA